jgi:hypothetical protein
MLKPGRVFAVLLVGTAFAACGGSDPAAPSPSSDQLQVAGSYQITPTLGQNGCGSVTVLPGPAQVTHAAGATEVRLSHVGQTYSGRVQPNGDFTMDPLVISFAPGSTDTVRIGGRFSTTGFEADVSVDAAHAGAAPCRYLVRWQATKQGSPNVIPG